MLPMAYIIFFVLISIPLVFGERLTSPSGAIYKYIDRKENLLGTGGTSKVIMGQKTFEGHTEIVAMKFGNENSKKKLSHEQKIYNLLGQHVGIPEFHDYFSDMNGVLITELLGYDLQTYFEKLKGFSIKTTMMIGVQVLKRLRYVHSKGLVYYDVKPENFAVNVRNISEIKILDFGFTKTYLDANGRHIFKHRVLGMPAAGTGDFLSLDAHLDPILTRKDDIESLAYMLILFVRGNLPWDKYEDDMQGWANMYYMKNATNIEVIVGNRCTVTLTKFLSYARGLKFEQEPEYDMLEGLLLNELHVNHLVNDNKFDWDHLAIPKRNIILTPTVRNLLLSWKSPENQEDGHGGGCCICM